MNDGTRRSSPAEQLMKRMPEHLQRLSWPREKLEHLQLTRLRNIVGVAKRDSPWHRERLADIDPETLTLQNLRDLPVSTKSEMMDHWDEVVTDRRLNLHDAFEHLEHEGADVPLLDELKVVTSSGSTGRVGIWVFDPEGWAELQATTMRMTLRVHLGAKGRRREPVVAVVAASSPNHISAQIVRGYGAFARQYAYPVTLPFHEIVEGLNACDPTTLSGYPSMLAELARASETGRLKIRPERVVTSAEALLDEQREIIERVWDLTVSNVWAVSEAGSLAVGCFQQPGMHLSEDVALVEPVDEDGEPVGPGQTAVSVYVTNLVNRVQPVIRYELTDRITLLDQPCTCGSTLRRIEDIQERFDEVFEWEGGARAHTHLFRSALSHEPSMTDYQILQTERGVRVLLKSTEEIDPRSVASHVRASLEGIGLNDPQVQVELDARLLRLPTGKLKRYVPLGFGQNLREEAA